MAVRGEGPVTATTSEIPPDGLDLREAVNEYQGRLILEALKRSGGVQRRAAKLLKLSPTTLNEMIHRLGVDVSGED